MIQKTYKKTLLSAILITSTLFSASAMASTPSTESVQRLMQVMPNLNVVDNVNKQNVQLIGRIISSKVNQTATAPLTDAQKQQLNSIAQKYIELSINQLNTQEVQQNVTNTYAATLQKHFTQEEVDAQIEFYGSDLGKSILGKQSLVIQDYLNASMPMLVSTSEQNIKGFLPQLEQEVEAAVKSN